MYYYLYGAIYLHLWQHAWWHTWAYKAAYMTPYIDTHGRIHEGILCIYGKIYGAIYCNVWPHAWRHTWAYKATYKSPCIGMSACIHCRIYGHIRLHIWRHILECMVAYLVKYMFIQGNIYAPYFSIYGSIQWDIYGHVSANVCWLTSTYMAACMVAYISPYIKHTCTCMKKDTFHIWNASRLHICAYSDIIYVHMYVIHICDI